MLRIRCSMGFYGPYKLLKIGGNEIRRQKCNARRRQELQAAATAISLLLSVKKVAFFGTPAGNLEKDNSSIIKTNFFIRQQTYTVCAPGEIPKTERMYHRIWGPTLFTFDFIQLIQYFLRMCLVLWSPENMGDNTFFIDDKSGAEKSHVFSAIKLLFPPDSVAFNDLSASIGNQAEGKGMTARKGGMAVHVIRTNANHFYSFLHQYGIVIPEVTSLDGTGRGHIPGVKKQRQYFAFKI